MTPHVWTVAITSMWLGASLFAGGETEPPVPAREPTAPKSATSKTGEDRLRDPEAAYRELLRLHGLLRDFWRKQPENQLVLGRYVAEMRRGLAALRAFHADPDAKQRPDSPVTAQEANRPVEPRPAKSSTQPRPEDAAAEEIRQRDRRIDETLLTPDLAEMKQRATRRLQGVPPKWILRQCRRAERLLDDLERALAQERPDQRALDRLIEDLRDTLDDMAQPPDAPVKQRPGDRKSPPNGKERARH